LDFTLKQRLAGAIVLISLGVIFIPMLLDGAGMREQQRLEVRMPPKPRYDFPRHIEPVPLPEPVKPKPDSAAKPDTSEKTVASAEKPPKPVKETTKASSAPEPVKEAKPVDKTPATPMTSYVVQVGSFSDRNNALALRDKLRKAGFPAFAEDVSAQGKTMVRIKVGPVLKRTEAEQIQKKLNKDLGIKGKVYTHR
jgi:DedD protein